MKAHAFRSLSILVLIFGLEGLAAGGEPDLSRDGAQSRTVSGAGLDLARLPDAELLYRRIRSAAYSACRAQKARWDVKGVLHQKRCVEHTVEDAVVNAEQPLLTVVHRSFGERLADR